MPKQAWTERPASAPCIALTLIRREVAGPSYSNQAQPMYAERAHRRLGWSQHETIRTGRWRSLEASQMRIGIALLISLWCAGCALSEKPAALAPAPQQAAALEKTAPVADAASAKFECSDGTISTSQHGCLVSMARARLPPGQSADRAPSNSAPTANQPPTDATQ